MSTQQKTRVQQAADLPASTFGAIAAKAETTLSETVRAAYASDAQFVILGDTDHGSSKLTSALLSTDVLKVAAESGVTDLYLEYRPRLQGIVDKLTKGDITPEQYADQIPGVIAGMTLGETRKHIIEVEAPAMIVASRLGMDIHFIDAHNERALKTGDEAERDFREGISSEWRRQNRQEYNRMRYTVREGQEEAYWADRYRADVELGQRISLTAQDRRGLIIYGAGHGSHFNDLEDNLAGRAAKIDVHENDRPLRNFRENYAASPDIQAHYHDYSTGDPDQRHMDEDKPDLIFVMAKEGRGTLYQTTSTPEWLKKELEHMQFSPDIEGQKIIDHSLNRAARPGFPSP